MLVNILGITDDAKCYEMVRQLRWHDGIRCPGCDAARVVKQGRDDTEPHRQRYECRSCGRRFDDLTDTILAGHHQPLRVWVLVLYLMGLNLANEQIAKELDLDDAQQMTTSLRGGPCSGSPRSSSAARSSATRSTSWPGIRATPRRSGKGAARPPEATEGGTRAWDAGRGEAPGLRDDPADRRGGHPHAGRRQAEDDRPTDQEDDRPGERVVSQRR